MGGCATKPKDLKPDASEAPLPQQEEVSGEHRAQQQDLSRAVDAPVDDKPLKAEEAPRDAGAGETPEKAMEGAASGGGKEDDEEGKKRKKVEEEGGKEAGDGSVGNGKEDWHLDDNKRRSLGVLFMEDDGESVDGAAAAETSGQKESDESTPVVVVERSVEVILEEKESDKAEGSRPEDEVAKPEDAAKADGTIEQEVVPPHPVPPVVEPAVESQEKTITTEEALPTGAVLEENPKPEESTKDVVENVGSTEGSSQDATGAVVSIVEAVVVVATPLPEGQGKQSEQQHTTSDETSSEVHHVEAAGERDVVVEEQQQDAEIADPVTATETGSLPVVLVHAVEKIEVVKEEESNQTPPSPPVDLVVDGAAVVAEKVSNDLSVDEPAAPKLESAVEDSKPTAIEVSGDEKVAGEMEKAAAVAASDAEKEADEVDKAAAAAASSDEPAAPKLESAVEESKTGDPEATGEPDKAAPATSDTEKGSSAVDAAAIANVKQEAGQDGDELPLSTTGSTAA